MYKTNGEPVFVLMAIHQCGDEEIKHLAHVSPSLDDAKTFMKANHDFIVTKDPWFWAVTEMKVGVQNHDGYYPWLFDHDGMELK